MWTAWMSGTVRICNWNCKAGKKALSGEHEETVLHGEPSAKDDLIECDFFIFR